MGKEEWVLVEVEEVDEVEGGMGTVCEEVEEVEEVHYGVEEAVLTRREVHSSSLRAPLKGSLFGPSGSQS